MIGAELNCGISFSIFWDICLYDFGYSLWDIFKSYILTQITQPPKWSKIAFSWKKENRKSALGYVRKFPKSGPCLDVKLRVNAGLYLDIRHITILVDKTGGNFFQDSQNNTFGGNCALLIFFGRPNKMQGRFL